MSIIEKKNNAIASPFLSDGELNLADVLELLAQDKRLSTTRKRDMRSAINRLAKILKRDPALLPAKIGSLRHGINTIHPLDAGISKKTLQNIKSNVVAAFKYLGLDQQRTPTKEVLSPEWKLLYEQLPSDKLLRGLSRFCRYCSGLGIAPEAVSDKVIDDFMIAVHQTTFVKNSDKLHRQVTRLWNEAATVVEDWPKKSLTIPASKKPDPKTPLSSLPESFQQETKTYLAWLEDDDLFANHRPPQKCKPSTINQRRRYIGLAAAALVERGYKRDDLQTLADITTPSAIKDICHYYMEKNEGQPTGFLRTLAGALISVAVHWLQVDESIIHELVDIRKRLGQSPAGLTRKNREMLRRFDDVAILERLLKLPDQLAAEAIKADKSKKRAAVKMQTALAIEIFLFMPMRVGNLAALRLDQHILRTGGKKGLVHIALEEPEVKNDLASDYELAPHLVERLDLYLAEFRHRLTDADNPYLFPGQHVLCKAPATLRQHIQDVIYKYTGIKMNAHQFRHLAAKMILDANPANFELAKRILRHKSMRTTVNFYAGLDSNRSFKLYDQTVLKLRHGDNDD